jgi:hypothetical protein
LRASAVIAAAAVALSLAARVYLLLSRPLWHDERYTAWISRRSPAEIVEALRLDSGPPAFYLLEKLSGAAAAPASRGWALRGVSFAAALLLIAAIGASLRGRERALGVSLAACFALLNLYAAEARPYALLALLAFCVFRLSQSGRETPARLFLLAAAGAAALYTHYLALFAVAAAAGAALYAKRPRSAAACAVALPLFAPWMPVLLAQPREAMAWLREPLGATLAGFASALGGVGRVPSPFGAAPPGALAVAGGVAGIALLGAAAAAARVDREVRIALVAALLTLGLALAASAFRPLAFAGRSEMAVLPVWIWALARAGRESRAVRWGAVTAAALGMAATLAVILSRHPTDTPGAAVRRLTGMTRRGDAVLAGPYFYLAARLARRPGRPARRRLRAPRGRRGPSRVVRAVDARRGGGAGDRPPYGRAAGGRAALPAVAALAPDARRHEDALLAGNRARDRAPARRGAAHLERGGRASRLDARLAVLPRDREERQPPRGRVRLLRAQEREGPA